MAHLQSWIMPGAARRPTAERSDQRNGFQSPFCRLVDLDRSGRRELRLAHETAFFELGESLRQHIRADSLEVSLELGKAAGPVSELPKHEHRPPFAEQFHRMSKAARVLVAPFLLALPRLSYFF